MPSRSSAISSASPSAPSKRRLLVLGTRGAPAAVHRHVRELRERPRARRCPAARRTRAACCRLLRVRPAPAPARAPPRRARSASHRAGPPSWCPGVSACTSTPLRTTSTPTPGGPAELVRREREQVRVHLAQRQSAPCPPPAPRPCGRGCRAAGTRAPPPPPAAPRPSRCWPTSASTSAVSGVERRQHRLQRAPGRPRPARTRTTSAPCASSCASAASRAGCSMRGGHHAAALGSRPGAEGALERQRVRLGAGAGEADLLRLAAQHPRHLRPRRVQPAPRLAAAAVHAGGVAEAALGEARGRAAPPPPGAAARRRCGPSRSRVLRGQQRHGPLVRARRRPRGTASPARA